LVLRPESWTDPQGEPSGTCRSRVDSTGPGRKIRSACVGLIGQPDGKARLLSSPREGESASLAIHKDAIE
jgi:hypothetical protein